MKARGGDYKKQVRWYGHLLASPSLNVGASVQLSVLAFIVRARNIKASR